MVQRKCRQPAGSGPGRSLADAFHRIHGLRLPLDTYVHQLPLLREGASQTLWNTLDDDDDALTTMLAKMMARVGSQK